MSLGEWIRLLIIMIGLVGNNMSDLVIYSGTDFNKLDEEIDLETFYQLLYKLNEATLLISQAKNMDDLYRITVEVALSHLQIDRLGILLFDKSTNRISGTWGTDEKGTIRSEYNYTSMVDGPTQDVISLLDNQNKVCIWHNVALYEFDQEEDYQDSEIIGHGWNGAIGLWEHDRLIGWFACDNLLNNKPFNIEYSHILRLFCSSVSELRLRFLAQEKIEQLNQTLESKVRIRTSQLLQAQSQLEKKVEQRTLALQNQNQTLQQTIERLENTENLLSKTQMYSALKDLVVGVAHEMNTPIGTAYTASTHLPCLVQDIYEAIENRDSKKLTKRLTDIETSSQMVSSCLRDATALIAEFKTLSTIDAEVIPEVEIHIRDWLASSVTLAELQEKCLTTLTIEYLIKTDIDKVTVKSEVLQQIVKALLINAYQHGLTDQHATIQISVDLKDNTLLLTVEDSGPGIPVGMQNRIFNPFVTTARSQGQKGLGLNLAFNLVEYVLMGKFSYFDSTLGGAGFLIACPVHYKDCNEPLIAEQTGLLVTQ